MQLILYNLFNQILYNLSLLKLCVGARGGSFMACQMLDHHSVHPSSNLSEKSISGHSWKISGHSWKISGHRWKINQWTQLENQWTQWTQLENQSMDTVGKSVNTVGKSISGRSWKINQWTQLENAEKFEDSSNRIPLQIVL